jgi:type II secretory pathway component GspD/PulD (secretin)
MQPRVHGLKAAALARLILPLSLFAGGTLAHAQKPDTSPDAARPCSSTSRMARQEDRQARSVLEALAVPNTVGQNDANEVLVALRNMLDPSVKIYLVASQNTIMLFAPPEDQAQAQRIIADLTRPRKAFHLRFEVTTYDGKQRVSSKTIEVEAVAGQRTTLKQGAKIPISIHPTPSDPTDANVTFLDVGDNLDVTLTDLGSSLALKSKLEESRVSDTRSGFGATDPIIDQTVIEGVALLAPGRSIALGSAEITGTTRRIELSVVAEPVS